ncbi:MAG: dockerin type I repeat-containing protein [Clostridia bacterium]|nr:dockerin type I repeat-containing protein [Clostridia bacterium]
MKKVLSVMLVLVMLLTQLALPSFALSYDDEWVDPYEGLAVESMTVTSTKGLIENIDGWEEEIYDDNGEITDTYFYYDTYCAEIYATVVYENGEVEEGYFYELYGYYEMYDNQSEEPWGLGKHQVTFVYRDIETELEVEVVETPVKSISAVAQNTLVEGWDGGTYTYEDEDGNEIEETYYYFMQSEPVFTVTMKDGSVIVGDEHEIYEQTGYWIDYDVDQEKNPFVIGKNTVEFSFLGVPCQCEIEVVPNPYKGVSIKGENEVYLVFEGVDEKDSYETKIIEFVYYEWGIDGGMEADILTEDGKSYYVYVNCDVNEDGFSVLNKNVSLDIGPFTTNTLETCNYFKAAYVLDIALYYSVNYYATSQETAGKQFEGYNADEEADVDHIVALSTYMGDYFSDYEYTDFGAEYTLTVEEAEKNIEKLFGITDIDVKESEFYKNKLFGGKIEVAEYWDTLEPVDAEIVFEDGKWLATADIFDYYTEEFVGHITIALYEDGTIYSIDIEKDEIRMGDVNCDGKITAIDARLVLQYVAGLVDEYDLYMSYADVSGDGKITAVDARIILQKVAGLIE